jgi:valine--pyruvate aminotransferase
MRLSSTGAKMAGLSGLRSIMDDITTTTTASPGDWLNLSIGNPAPIRDVVGFWRDLTRRTLDSEPYARLSGSYGPSRGSPALVSAVVEYFRDRYNWDLAAENVVVGPGSQMLCFMASALFTGSAGPGRLILPIAPDYTGYQGLVLEQNGIVGVPGLVHAGPDRTFRYGMDLVALGDRNDIGMILLSSPANPSGRSISAIEQSALMDIAEHHDVPLILDHAYGAPFPGIAGTLVPPPQHPHVINVFTLSKAGLPGERIAFAVGPERYISAMVSFLANSALHAPALAQAVAARALQERTLDRLVSEVIGPFYRRRRRFVEQLLHAALPLDIRWHLHASDGGMFCWLWIEEDWFDDLTLYQILKQRQVFIVPGRHFFPAFSDQGHQRQCVRISITADEAVLSEGVSRLAMSLGDLRERHRSRSDHSSPAASRPEPFIRSLL